MTIGREASGGTTTSTICEACGVRNPVGTEFCLSCGSFQDWAVAETPEPERGSVATQEVNSEGETENETTLSSLRPVPGQPSPAGVSPDAADPSGSPNDTPPAAGAAGGNGDDWDRTDTHRGIFDTLFGTNNAPATEVLPAPVPVAILGGGGQCPLCGRVNDVKLRFCGKCGHTLVVTASGLGHRVPQKRLSWWGRLFDNKDRAARREYRHSLPPLYRWRRVLIGILVLALLVAGLFLLKHDPRSVVLDGYYSLRGRLDQVPGVKAAVDPRSATMRDSSPDALVDVTEAAWTMRWRPTTEGQSCGGAPNTGVISLTLPATRIRQIVLRPGLPSEDPSRLDEFRPQSIGVRFDNGDCRRFILDDLPTRQLLAVDSGVEVSNVQIGFDTAFPASKKGRHVLSMTEVILKARPVT